MKRILFSLLILMSAHAAMGQHLLYKRLYSTTGPSNHGSTIIQRPNGDLIVCGIRSVPILPNQYVANVYLMRTNAAGDTLWTKEIGTAIDRELAYGMKELPDGRLVIAGSINLPPNGLSDAYVACTDSAGNILWQKRYGGSQSDFATDVTFDGQHIIVCGNTESYGAGGNDAWLLKLDEQGDTVWTKTFGGAARDDAWGVEVGGNAYYFTGGTYSYANGLYDDAWIVKTDTSGKELWHKTYGVKDKVDWAWGLTPVKDNGTVTGFVITGVKNTEESQPGNVYGNMHLIKTDTGGNVVWDKSVGGPGNTWRREGFDVKQLPDGGFVVCGYKLEPFIQSQQLYVVRTDDKGDVKWENAYGTNDSNYYANSLAVTNDGGWVITGSVFTPGQPIRYIYITKFSPYGVTVDNVTQNADIILYPNPAQGVVYIAAGKGAILDKVLLYSLDGRLVQSHDEIDNSETITLHINIPGVYVAEIYTGQGVIRRTITSVK